MSQMSTFPVFKCTRCGKPVTVEHLATAEPDADLSKLFAMMKSLEKIIMCKDCLAAYNWYSSQGRSEEFLRAALAPLLTIYKPETEVM